MMDWLQGKQVACTGKLASLTRKEAADVIAAHGGQWVPAVNRHTAFLIVGQEGWPLQQDGKLTMKLQKADKLQQNGQPLTVLSEEEFLARLGLENRSEDVHRLYTLAQLTRILAMPRDRLRGWIQAGLIQPREKNQGIDYFDFRQVLGARTLCDLARAGVGLEQVRRSLRQLKTWLKDVDQPLAQLALLEGNGQLLVRLEEGLADTSGQLLLDFAEEADGEETAQLTLGLHTAEDWFELGCQHEDDERLEDAVHAYRQALLLGGPHADIGFNLANVLYALGRKEQASERYRQVLEMNAAHAEAWNNLGTVLVELGEEKEAEAAFRRALELNYQDAHYNLADLLESQSRQQEARKHWQAFVQSGAQGSWGQYARSKIV